MPARELSGCWSTLESTRARSRTGVTSVPSPLLTSVTSKLTCGPTPGRSHTSASYAPTAAITEATCPTIKGAGIICYRSPGPGPP
ncbi:hypothetical protein LEMLEM_LOCUS15116 [Lemmus lemmus]